MLLLKKSFFQHSVKKKIADVDKGKCKLSLLLFSQIPRSTGKAFETITWQKVYLILNSELLKSVPFSSLVFGLVT